MSTLVKLDVEYTFDKKRSACKRRLIVLKPFSYKKRGGYARADVLHKSQWVAGDRPIAVSYGGHAFVATTLQDGGCKESMGHHITITSARTLIRGATEGIAVTLVDDEDAP